MLPIASGMREVDVDDEGGGGVEAQLERLGEERRH